MPKIDPVAPTKEKKPRVGDDMLIEVVCWLR